MAVGGVKVIAATVAGPLAKAHSPRRSSFYTTSTNSILSTTTNGSGHHKLHLASDGIIPGGGDAAYGSGYRARAPTSVTGSYSDSNCAHDGATAWSSPGLVGKELVASSAVSKENGSASRSKAMGPQPRSALKKSGGGSSEEDANAKKVLWLEGTTGAGIGVSPKDARDADAEGGSRVKFALVVSSTHHSTPTTPQLATLPPPSRVVALSSSSQSHGNGEASRGTADTLGSTTSAGATTDSNTTGFGFGPTILSGPGRLRTSPERNRTKDNVLNQVPEDRSMDFDLTGPHDREARGAFANRTAGSDPGEDPVEDEESISVLEEELEDQGLYLGSYKRLVALYTFVPLTALLFFLLLAWLPTYAYPNKTLPAYPYSALLPFPLPELLTSVAVWSLVHHVREPLFSFGLFIVSPYSSETLSTVFPLVFSATFHALISISLRLLIIVVLMIPHYLVFGHPTWEDPSFDRVWWVALGWAAAESVVAIKQGYEAIALYRDVLIPVPSTSKDFSDLEGSVRELSQRPKAYGATENWVHAVSGARREEPSPVTITGAGAVGGSSPPLGHYRPTDIPPVVTERDSLLPSRFVNGRSADLELRSENAMEVLVDRDLEQLNLIKAREELEDVYGIPFIRIPVFISCLQRVNTFLMSLGIFLLLSSAYIRSTIAHPSTPSDLNMPHSERIRSNIYLFFTIPILLGIHIVFEIMHTPLILPRLMVHTVVYIGLLVSLSVFFAGLGMWEALA